MIKRSLNRTITELERTELLRDSVQAHCLISSSRNTVTIKENLAFSVCPYVCVTVSALPLQTNL